MTIKINSTEKFPELNNHQDFNNIVNEIAIQISGGMDIDNDPAIISSKNKLVSLKNMIDKYEKSIDIKRNSIEMLKRKNNDLNDAISLILS